MKLVSRLRLTVGLAMTLFGGAIVAATLPATGGTVAIQPKTADGDYDPALSAFADAVAAAFAARNFTILDDSGHAAMTAELILNREDVGTGRAKVPGQRKLSVYGPSVAVPLSTGASDLVPLRRTRLELRIHRRGETAVAWRGAAVAVRSAAAKNGSDEAVAADLARAILRPYPAQPRDVIGVP